MELLTVMIASGAAAMATILALANQAANLRKTLVETRKVRLETALIQPNGQADPTSVERPRSKNSRKVLSYLVIVWLGANLLYVGATTEPLAGWQVLTIVINGSLLVLILVAKPVDRLIAVNLEFVEAIRIFIDGVTAQFEAVSRRSSLAQAPGAPAGLDARPSDNPAPPQPASVPGAPFKSSPE